MWTDETFALLEEEELEITNDHILIMLLILAGIKGDLEKELRAFYQKYGQDGVITYEEARKWISEKNHQRRLTALLLLVGTLFSVAAVDIEKHFRTLLTAIIAKESAFFSVKLNVGDLLKRKWGVDDLYWLQRLEADMQLWQMNIMADLKQSIHRQDHIDDILTKLDKRFTSIDRIFKALGLSESTAMGSLSRQAIFKELGISKYKVCTQEDNKVCEICRPFNGKIFPISAMEVGVTASPFHTNCRCYEIPIVE